MTVVTSEPVFFMSVHDIVYVGLFSELVECLDSKQNTPKKIDGGMVKPTMKHLERKGYKSTLEDEKGSHWNKER